jgi:hypothetical protein
MTDDVSPEENAPAAPEGRRRRSRRIALARLWVASVLVLSLGIAALAAYLMTREPNVVERVLPPPPPPGVPAETARRFETLRALNSGLKDQIEALRRELERSPECPPGTELDSAGVIPKPLPGGSDRPAGGRAG